MSVTAQCDGLPLRTGVGVGGWCAGVGTRSNSRARGGSSCECRASGGRRPSCEIWGSHNSVAEDSSRVRHDAWWLAPDVSTLLQVDSPWAEQHSATSRKIHIFSCLFVLFWWLASEPVVEITFPAAACWFGFYRNEYNGSGGQSGFCLNVTDRG